MIRAVDDICVSCCMFSLRVKQLLMLLTRSCMLVEDLKEPPPDVIMLHTELDWWAYVEIRHRTSGLTVFSGDVLCVWRAAAASHDSVKQTASDVCERLVL